MTQYVRYITPSATVYGVKNSQITMVCQIYGDETSDPKWYKDSETTALTTTGDVTVTPETYSTADYTAKSTLVIANLEAANAAAYKCSATYTEGSTATETTQTLSISTEALSKFKFYYFITVSLSFIILLQY